MTAFMEGWARGTLAGAIGLGLGVCVVLVGRALGLDPAVAAIVGLGALACVAGIMWP